jgi:hypothetical protein
MNFDDILNLLARTSAKQPSPSAMDSYQYFWGDHPEKNKTAEARYERFGGQSDPLGGEIGRESSGYSANDMRFPASSGDAINRLPIKFRQKYLTMLGQMRQNFDQGSQQ